jgi:hypothetical protein
MMTMMIQTTSFRGTRNSSQALFRIVDVKPTDAFHNFILPFSPPGRYPANNWEKGILAKRKIQRM